MSRPSVETARGWQAKSVVGRDGEPLGRITHIYIDRSTGQPTWALIARGRLARKQAFVPLALAADEGDQVRVLVGRTAVEEAPRIRGGGELSGDDEIRLSEHYGEPTGAPSTGAGARRGFLGGEPDSRDPGAVPEWGIPPMRSAGGRRPARGRRLARAASLAALAGGVVMLVRSRRHGDQPTARPAARPKPAAAPKGALARRKRGQRARGGPALLRRAGLPAVMAAAALRARRRRSPRRSRRLLAGARHRGSSPRRRMTPTMPSLSMPSLSMPARSSHSRRRSRKMTGKLRLAAGFAAGYLLGAKAGRERYEQIMHQAKELWQRPEVQNVAAKGRETLGQAAQRGVGAASDRMEGARSSMAPNQQGSGQPDAAPGGEGRKAAQRPSGNDDPQRQPPSSAPSSAAKPSAEAARSQRGEPPASSGA